MVHRMRAVEVARPMAPSRCAQIVALWRIATLGAPSSKNRDRFERFRMSDWQDEWEAVDAGGKTLGGGQGSVVQVRHRRDRRIGALKRLHDEHQTWIERRYRMRQEVNALLAIGGKESPHSGHQRDPLAGQDRATLGGNGVDSGQNSPATHQ